MKEKSNSEVFKASRKPIEGIIIVLAFILSLPGCYEPIEDCLDPLAKNFEVTADRACADCCEYPQLIVNVTHAANEANLSFDSIYTADSLQFFQIKNVKFYMSGFRLYQQDGTPLGVENNIELNVLDNTGNRIVEVEDNYALILRETAKYTIGTILGKGDYSEIRFFVGIEGEANKADPTLLPKDHPLGIQADTMHWSQQAGYIFNKITICSDLQATTSVNYEIGGILNLVEVVIPYEITIKSGFDVSIPLKVNYLKWFTGIDFESNELEIRRKLVDNTASAFSIKE